MKKFLLILLLLIIGLGVVGYLTIKGKVPVLYNAVFQQVDLGIDESPDIIYAFYEEIGYVDNLKGDTPKSGELVFEGGIDLDHTFTQSEINSWLSAWENSWTGIPFKNLQIRINSDGTVEASSLISLKEAESIGRTLGYSQEDIDKAKDFLKYIPDPLPLYAKGTASIKENQVNLDIQNFKVVGYSLPEGMNSTVEGVIEDIISRARNLSTETDIKSAEVTSEGVKFLGTVPASVSIK